MTSEQRLTLTGYRVKRVFAAPRSKRWFVVRINHLPPFDAADRLLAGLWRHWVAGFQNAALMHAFGTCPDERTFVLLEGIRDTIGTAGSEDTERPLPSCADDRPQNFQ